MDGPQFEFPILHTIGKFVCVYVCMGVCLFVCMCIFTFVCMSVCMCV